MNVVVMIHGKAALPVRAIPLVTNWETMSPDVVVSALSCAPGYQAFKRCTAYRLEQGVPKEISPTWWKNFPGKQLESLHAEIKSREEAGATPRVVGRQQWRHESLLVLPEATFVWQKDFLDAHDRRFGVGRIALTDEDGSRLSDVDHGRRVTLDFDPFFPDGRVHGLVMAGFDTEFSDFRGQRASTVAWPWGTHSTRYLDELAAAVKHWWVNYDPSDSSTAPTNEEVSDWLRARGMAGSMADKIATIIRAEGLRPGPRK